MAGNKNNTYNKVNENTVKRGTKGAETPSEKEKTPIEEVISRDIAKIVKGIENFETKFESINTAIASIKSENLLTTLENINDKFNPILGALYGISNINDKNPKELLNKLGKVDPKLTMFGTIDSTIKSIYEFLISQNKSSYKPEDLANVVSAEIEKLLKEIEDNNSLESLTKKLEDMKSSILSNFSAKNINNNDNKQKDSSNIFNALEQNTDSIVNSINDNANFIIDILNKTLLPQKETDKFLNIEKFDLGTARIIDAISPKNEPDKFLDIKNFYSGTAQIIDAINAKDVNASPKDINTTALQYNININASGLDSDTIEALIDLSKISTDSTEYLENLNNILSNLSNFEKLNNIKLDNKNIKNIVNSINNLSEIKLVGNDFNQSSIDSLKYFIDTLGSIDVSALNKFNKDSLKSIAIIADTLNYFSNLKLDNFNKNIKALDVNRFVELLNNLKEIPVYGKEEKTTISDMSELFYAISSISGFNDNKFSDLSSNLRKMIRLTEKPNTFTSFKLSDRGLIHILMHNIGEIASSTEQTFDNTKNISKMLNFICSISQYDPKLFNKLKDTFYILALITDKEEPYLYKAFKNIEELAKSINNVDEHINVLKTAIKGINSIENINIDNIENINKGLNILIVSFKYLKKFAGIPYEKIDISKSTNALNVAVGGINSIERVKIENIEHLNESLNILIESFEFLKKLAGMPYKKIKNISKNTNELNTVVVGINSIERVKIENIEHLDESINILIASFKSLKKLASVSSKKKNVSDNINELKYIVEGINSIKTVNVDGVKKLNESINVLIKSFAYLKILSVISSKKTNISNNINELKSFVEGVNSIETVNINNIKNINESIKTLIESFNSLKNLESVSSKKTNISDNINELKSIVEGVNSIETINADNIENLNEGLKSLIVSFAFFKILAIISSSKQTNILNNINELKSIVGGVNSIENINEGNIKNINEGLKSLIASFIYLRILAFIPSKEIDVSKHIKILNDVVKQINSIKEVKNAKNIKLLNNSIKNIFSINILLAAVGISAPLAYIGAILMQNEISILSKIVGKINEIKPVKEDVLNNLKSLAIIIVAASGILLFGALVGGFVSTHLLEILGFTVALSAFIFLTIGAFNLATRGMKEAKLNAGEFGKLLLISSAIMILGGVIMTMYLPLVLGSLAFSVALGTFILLTIGALNLATQGMDDATKNAKDFAILIGVCAAVMVLGGLIVTMYMPLILGSLVFTVLLSLFILTTIGALNLATNGMNEAAKNAKDFAILIGVCAAVMLLGGLIVINYTKIIFGSLGFSLLLGAFIFLTIGALNLATKGMNDAAKNAKEFAILIGISAAALLIGGLFMLIPGMPLAVLEFAGIFVLFLGITLFAYALASKHIKEAKKTAIGFGIVVLLTSIALLLGGGVFLSNPGLDIECLKFAGISALFIAIFGVAIWLLGKLKKKDLIQGELALAGIAVLIGGFGYAFTFVAEAMDMISKVKDPWTQLGIMGTVFAAMVALVAGVVALTTTTSGIGAAAIAAAEGLIAGIAGIIWLLGKAMSSIAQSMADLDKVKDFDSENVVKAIGDYISLIPELMPLASPKIVISMLAVKSSVGSMSEAILAIATSVKAVCDLKTEDGRQLTSADFTLAAENIKSVVTILGHSLIEVYEGNEDMFSSGNTIGDLLGADTIFSRVAKSCATMGQLITDISAGVKDFADLKMPIYGKNGKIIGYRSMNDKDFENAGKSVAQVVTCIGEALIGVYDGHEDMFEWKLIGDNPFAMVSKSCLTMGKLITNISAGVKDFAELRIPIYDVNGKITGYRKMDMMDFINAGINVGLVITCLANAIMAVYNDPKNKNMFTDPSRWHTSADKTPFGMVVKAMTGVGTLVKDGAAAIKEIADMKVDFADLENKGSGEDIQYGKVSKIVTIIARSIKDAYDLNPAIFTDDSFWHTDPQKTPFGMVMQCLNNVIPLVKNAAAAINDISQMNFKSTDLDEKGELSKKINGIVSVIPKAAIDIMTNETYKKYLTNSDYIETYENMKNAYSKISEIIKEIIGSYDSINKLEYDGTKIHSMKGTIKLMMLSLCNVITDQDILNLLDSEIFKNDEKSDKNKLSIIKSSFEEFNKIIGEVNTAYDSINKSLSNLGVKDNDTTVITTITNNLNTMISKLSESIKLNTISLDAKSVNNFSTNVSSFYSSIETLTRAYKLIPEDLSNYGNVVKAMGEINYKISKIPNLEAFNAEQQTLEKYVITLNNLDLTKVKALSNLMSIMNELSTKLGALDNFTEVLNKKISATLANLANQIKISGDIINKADNLQKKRHEAIKDSIKEIQHIMNQKLIVEVNHNNSTHEDIPTGGTTTDVQTDGNGSFNGGIAGGNGSFNGGIDGGNGSFNGGIAGGVDYSQLQTAIRKALEAGEIIVKIQK